MALHWPNKPYLVVEILSLVHQFAYSITLEVGETFNNRELEGTNTEQFRYADSGFDGFLL